MIPRKNDGSEPLPVRIDGIPSELRQCPQWVTWRLEARNGQRTKVPYASDSKHAKTTDRRTWSAFELAVQTYRNEGFDGIGFVFGAHDGFCGIDLDNCRNPENGVIEPWAMEIIQGLSSYSEVSPSGSGVKIFLRGKIPGTRRRRGNIEMYDAGRYFAVTGHCFDSTPTNVESRQKQIEALHGKVFGPTLSDEDAALVQMASCAKNGVKFRRLWDGDTTGDPSDSEADLALCSILAFWVGGDRSRIDRLFRASGLDREKWKRPDYRERTIQAALNGRTEADSFGGRTNADCDFAWTDTGNAERLVAAYGDNFRFRSGKGGDSESGTWFVWTGTRWESDVTYRIAQWELLGDEWRTSHVWRFAEGIEAALSFCGGRTVRLLERRLQKGPSEFIERRSRLKPSHLSIFALCPRQTRCAQRIDRGRLIKLARFFTHGGREADVGRQILDQMAEACRQRSIAAHELLCSTILEAALRTLDDHPFREGDRSWKIRISVKKFCDEYLSEEWNVHADDALKRHKRLRHRNAHPDWLAFGDGAMSDERLRESLDDRIFLARFYGYMILALAGSKDLKPEFPPPHEDWPPVMKVTSGE